MKTFTRTRTVWRGSHAPARPALRPAPWTPRPESAVHTSRWQGVRPVSIPLPALPHASWKASSCTWDDYYIICQTSGFVLIFAAGRVPFRARVAYEPPPRRVRNISTRDVGCCFLFRCLSVGCLPGPWGTFWRYPK